ncbi:MAG: DNA double-strand break repair nuclease NurA [Anaerolineae bacterium]
MPIDFLSVYQKIQEIGQGTRQRKKTMEERRQKARQLLAEWAHNVDALRAKVDAAKQADPTLRCAVPLKEPLDAHYPAPAPVIEATVIAADGSQINPDRHAAVQFGLINVGAILMKHDAPDAPQIFTESALLYGEELLLNGAPLSEGMVALRRDLAERQKLEELAKNIHGPVVTFTDGPLELWGAQGEDARSYAEFLEKYKTILSRLQTRGVITAGYVDKPSADLVIRLLEIAAADAESLGHIREFHPLLGVSDRWLFGEREKPLLPAGHRSAVFKLQSSSEKNYSGVLELHFFYLNVGSEVHPWPVRVEIPKWVAEDKSKLDILHSILLAQCKLMSSKPYPYLLNRAHEIALVRHEEKQQIEQLLWMEMRKQGEEPDDPSYKQSGKDSLESGKKRYGK